MGTNRTKDPGLFVFCILSSLDRVLHVLFGTSNLMKQYEIECAKDPTLVSTYKPYGFDLLLPSSPNQLCKLYWIGFWYYCVFLRLSIIIIMTVYCAYQWEYMTVLWKCLLPIITLIFIIIDFHAYVLIYRRSIMKS